MDTFPWALSLCVPLFCLLISLAFSGNSLVIAAIFYDRKLRKQRENLFLVSLALSDLFVSALVMVLAAANDLLGYWPFGAVFCQFWICLDITCCTASILNLCAIALDRFIHISRPMRYARFVSRRVICAAVCAIWLLSASLGIAQIAFGATDGPGMEEERKGELEELGGTAKEADDWSANGTTAAMSRSAPHPFPPPLHHHHYQCQLQLSPAYAVFSSLLSFFLPATLMLFLYYRLYLYARRHVRSIQAQLKQATSLLILQLASDRVRQVVVRPSMGLVPPSVALQYEAKRLSGAGVTNGTCRGESSHVSVAVHKGSDTATVDATVRQGTPVLSATLRKAKLADNNNYGGEESPFTPSPNKRHNGSGGGGGGGSSDRKARTTLGVIMGTFLVCWLPFFVVNVWRSFLPELCPVILFQAVTWLGYANSSVNPIIYGIFNRDFRRAFSRIVNKLLHCLQQEEAAARSETESIRCRRKGENNNIKVERGGWRWRLRSWLKR